MTAPTARTAGTAWDSAEGERHLLLRKMGDGVPRPLACPDCRPSMRAPGETPHVYGDVLKHRHSMFLEAPPGKLRSWNELQPIGRAADARTPPGLPRRDSAAPASSDPAPSPVDLPDMRPWKPDPPKPHKFKILLCRV